MIDSHYKYLFSSPEYKTARTNVQILRIILDKEQTRIDLGYQATSQYKRGGWVRMSEDTFIRTGTDGHKLKIRGSEHIPRGERKMEFKTTQGWLYFSLFFPPIPFKTGLIDLIETEKKDESAFNFYDIQMNISAAIKLL
jgi:hypothetical protein